jgi:DUF971 family protein
MPIPARIHLHKQSQTLELSYEGGDSYALPAEFLRVFSPSAEVRGHGNPVLQHGKQQVGIESVKPVGNYAVLVLFSDGHDTGIYSWDYLYELCQTQDERWQSYLDELNAAGLSRDPDVQPLVFKL